MTLYYGVFDNSLALRSFDFISVARPGLVNIIDIKKTAIDKLGEPFNKCDDNTIASNTQLTKEIASMGSEYRQEICFNLCRLHYMEKYCNCSLAYQLGLGGNDTCDTVCIKKIRLTAWLESQHSNSRLRRKIKWNK